MVNTSHLDCQPSKWDICCSLLWLVWTFRVEWFDTLLVIFQLEKRHKQFEYARMVMEKNRVELGSKKPPKFPRQPERAGEEGVKRKTVSYWLDHRFSVCTENMVTCLTSSLSIISCYLQLNCSIILLSLSLARGFNFYESCL